MKLLIFLLLCSIVSIFCKTTHKPTATTRKLECEGVHVDGKFHMRHTLMSGLNRPYQLVYYNGEHQVFYSHNEGEDTEDTFGIAYVKINDTEPTPVKGVKNGFALAIDEHNKKIYFGGSEGIYCANLTNLEHKHHIIKDKDIWEIFYHKHHLYFIDYPSRHVYKYDIENEGKPERILKHVDSQIHQFIIDGDEDMFITTKNGLHEIKKGTNHTIHYSEAPKKIRAMEVDHKGVPHFAAQSNIYVANKTEHTLIKIASIRNLFGLTFDSHNNIIYSNAHAIVKLLPHDCK